MHKIRKKILILFLLLLGLFCFTSTASAAPKTVNVVSSAKAISGGKWVKDSRGLRFRLPNGTYAKNIWLKRGGKIYRIEKNGYLKTGWISYNGNLYYAASNGALYVKKLVNVNGGIYYLQPNGICAKNKWVRLGYNYYYFQKNGKMAISRQITTGGKTYYVNETGIRVKSTWVKIGDKNYYFGPNGARLANKWVKTDNVLYYVNYDGSMLTNRWIGKYYVGADGTIQRNCYIDGYYLNSAGQKVYKQFTGDYIFVGDSRMVGISRIASDDEVLYLADRGRGYVWLKDVAAAELNYYLKQNPYTTVLMALGVNDLWNANSYISYYKKLMRKYPRATFYFLSVNPVDEVKEAVFDINRKNSTIVSFNKKLKSAFRSSYIDSYSYLKKNGFDTLDGLHYTEETYQTLYRYIRIKMK